ncbi:MAG: putative lipid II flippase FtsW [Bryobacteraceae bacterium]|nr:putative lipid II flippase FtsW [Bryobacteraceae bacterium]
MAQRVRTDWVLFTAILILVAAGMLVLWSAGSAVGQAKQGSSLHYPLRQLLWATGSLAAMMILKSFDYRNLNRGLVIFPAVSIVLILLALVRSLPSQRWFHLGLANFQPSELAKPVLALFLAYLVAARANAINSRQYTLIPAAAVIGLLAGAVVGPDLGTAVVLALSAIVVFLIAGMEKRYLLLALLVGLALFVHEVKDKPYRISRMFAWVNPSYSLLDSWPVRALNPGGSWKATLQLHAPTDNAKDHLEQSLIAVGSGGLTGKGPMQSTQKLLFLPEAHTDFIFAILAEEYGLIGALSLLSLYLIIFWRGLRIFSQTPDLFGKYLALGVSLMFLIQALINMSVVTGLFPTKGITLPLVSYGGSSFLGSMISLGLLQSVSDHSA